MPPTDNLTLAEDIAGFTHDPLGYVLYNFPWGVPGTALEKHTGPRKWQRETLVRIGEKLRAGVLTGFADVIQEATSSGHGSGKSALVSWIVKWGLDTFEDTRIVVTANTEKQLTTKTWPEVAKWHALSLTKDWLTCTATALYSTDPTHEKNWRADAIPWSEHNTEAFAGLHNEGKRLVLVFDEASKIADKVWEVAEGALTDANTEIIWAVFGNPTRPTGRFRECFRTQRHRWHTQQIDCREVEGTNKTLFEKWVADYGEDSDFVKVRVRGMFPSLSTAAVISEKDADAAYGRKLRPDQFNFAPIIIACDPAWMGDDMLTIGRRQGLFYEILDEIPKNDNDAEIAQRIAMYEDEPGREADAVFIDLGYGTGIASVGRMWGRSWQLVSFSESPNDDACLNKRAEMALGIRDWLKAGGSIPNSGVGAADLREELTAVEVRNPPRPDGKIQLVSKDDTKAILGRSPNHFDCLGLTFARPVTKKQNGQTRQGRAVTDYDPHAGIV